MDKNILELNSVDVGYRKKVLLKDVCIKIAPGKIVTLIGPNGAGKSTILKSIVREISTLGGTIVLDGKDMSGLNGNDIAKKLSMVMTERPRPEYMTCREVVATGRYPYSGMFGILDGEDEKKVSEAINLLDAKDIENCYFNEISDGQKQRILLARALCQDPDVLVLDEPTTFLDVKYKLDLLNVILNIARTKNIAVIMSLHELDIAMKISDYICAVDKETVSTIDTPENIIENGIIEKLYNISSVNYKPLTGALYLNGFKKDPQVFVIGGGGSGIPIYYKLHREAVPFVAGILATEDKEYEAAASLAVSVINTEPFTPPCDKEYEIARELMDKCKYYICTVKNFGPLNNMNLQLLNYAKERGIKEWQK